MMKGITFLLVCFYFILSSCEAQYRTNCALEGDRCLGDFQCCSALCYSGRCVAPNCLNDGQICASIIGFGECCSGYCGFDFRCHHRAARWSTKQGSYPWGQIDGRRYPINHYG